MLRRLLPVLLVALPGCADSPAAAPDTTPPITEPAPAPAQPVDARSSVDSTPENRVPPEPPFGIPDDIDLNWDARAGIPNDILWIRFETGAPLLARQRAIDAVNGRVIGGLPFDGMPIEGYYLVRIPSAGVEESLLPAIKLLESLPYVADVTPSIRVGLD